MIFMSPTSINQRVRKVAGNIIATVAGTSDGDGGPATSAFLNFPEGLAVDAASNLVVADSGNFGGPALCLGGNINTFGQLVAPLAVAVDASGNFYVTDDEPLVLEITKAGSLLLSPAIPRADIAATTGLPPAP